MANFAETALLEAMLKEDKETVQSIVKGMLNGEIRELNTILYDLTDILEEELEDRGVGLN